MQCRYRFAFVVAVTSIVFCNFSFAAPLEAYGALPLYENVAISPDGTKVAFVTTVGNAREVVIQPLDNTKEGITRLRAGSQLLRDLDWAGGDQLLVTVSQPREYFSGPQSETFALQNFDLRRKSVFDPMMWVEESWNLLAHNPDVRLVDGRPVVLIQSFTVPRMGDRFAMPALYRTDLRAQTTALIDGAPVSDVKKDYQWTIDDNGNAILQSIYDENTKTWSLSIKRNGIWQEIYKEAAPLETPDVVGLAPEEGTVYVEKRIDGVWSLHKLSLSDGKWGEVSRNKCCSTGYLTDPKTNRIAGIRWMDARLHYYFFQDSLQNVWEQVTRSFPGEEIRLVSWSGGFRRMILKVFGPSTGSAYILVDADTMQMSRVANYYRGIEASDIAAVKPIAYNAADGLSIPGYLTLPSGRQLKNLPLIVMPHGGPAARDTLEFDWFAQALASKGYLVLQPNYRGSWGLGEKFQNAGHGEYGGKMQTDLSDGVQALVKLGAVDPKRVCIVGASYGGYAALVGATMQPDVYRCAVSVSGVSDLKKNSEKYIYDENKNNRSMRFMLRYLGAKDVNDAVIAERSPAFHAADVKSPILLLHGDNDSVVSFEQSQIMADALKKAEKPHDFIKLKSEDHWMSRSETRTQMLQAVVKFLETNNPP